MSTPVIHMLFGEDTTRVRRTNPKTSHEAADLNDVRRSIGAVKDALRDLGPMYDEQIYNALLDRGYTFRPERIRTARKALEDKGLVVYTGRRALNSRNRRTQVWAYIEDVTR